MHGGLAQGIAQALFEEAVYDADGNLITGTFADYLLPVGGRPADVHHRPHRDAGDDQPAGRQGRRRGRHDRVHAGRGQRHRRRAAPVRRERRRDAVHARTRVWQARSSDGEPVARWHDPGGVRLRRARPRWTRPSGARWPGEDAQGARRRAEPAAAAAAAAGRAGARSSTSAGSPELRGVRDDGDALVIGAMTTHDEVLRDPLVARARAAAVAQATATVADPAGPAPRHVRRLAGARRPGRRPAGRRGRAGRRVRGRRADGRRTIPAADFFADYLTTALEPGRGAGRASGCRSARGWGAHYEKFHRTAQAWAIVGVAAAVRRTTARSRRPGSALTNMGPTPVRATAVEEALVGAAGQRRGGPARRPHAAEGTSPPTDLHGDGDYRRHLATVLTRRAVLAAAGA